MLLRNVLLNLFCVGKCLEISVGLNKIKLERFFLPAAVSSAGFSASSLSIGIEFPSISNNTPIFEGGGSYTNECPAIEYHTDHLKIELIHYRNIFIILETVDNQILWIVSMVGVQMFGDFFIQFSFGQIELIIRF